MDDYFASIENFFMVPDMDQPSETPQAAKKPATAKK
jgi:hypothetical protein